MMSEVELQNGYTFVLYSTNRSYFFIDRLDHESYNTDLLNSIIFCWFDTQISIKILQYFC